ncbi:hypothetical protein PT277_09850 [Acetobacteraceae bacterium ESL0709]|nr:hypothetical protein [Acetobacteraceae bacterium ESL0697]MDF7678984.1 hypothetical protein [Acetobacteraceae bacterium ESL0709]
MRLFLSAAVMASFFAVTSHAQAASSNCDNQGGDFLHRMATKEDCLNDRLDKKIDKYQQNRELRQQKVEEFRDRVKNAPEYEKQKLQDKLDKLDGKKKLDEKIGKFNQQRAERVEKFQQMKNQQQQDIEDLKAARQRTRDNVNSLLHGGL